MAPEWRRPEELRRLVGALRTTEPRPGRRWSELLDQVRRRPDQVAIKTT